MIWLALAVLAAVTVAPLVLTLRRAGVARGRRDAAMTLHRAQLAELERDLAEGRIDAADHTTAVLEVQRRLLAANASTEMPPRRSSRAPIVAAAILVPLAAVALYLPGASPLMPGMPLRARIEAFDKQRQQQGALLDELRRKIAALDPGSDQARAGYILLGNVEDSRGDLAAAVSAWQQALAVGYDPTLAAQVAEGLSQMAGAVTPEARALFEGALAKAGPDVPWRRVAEERLRQ